MDDKESFYDFIFTYPSYCPFLTKDWHEFQTKHLLISLANRQVDLRNLAPYLWIEVLMKPKTKFTSHVETAIRECHNGSVLR